MSFAFGAADGIWGIMCTCSNETLPGGALIAHAYQQRDRKEIIRGVCAPGCVCGWQQEANERRRQPHIIDVKRRRLPFAISGDTKRNRRNFPPKAK